jgi:hypothetical protein
VCRLLQHTDSVGIVLLVEGQVKLATVSPSPKSFRSAFFKRKVVITLRLSESIIHPDEGWTPHVQFSELYEALWRTS